MYQAHYMPKGRQSWIDPVQVEFEKKLYILQIFSYWETKSIFPTFRLFLCIIQKYIHLVQDKSELKHQVIYIQLPASALQFGKSWKYFDIF